MGKKLLNKTKQQMIKELHEAPEDKKRNITFSLDADLLESFKKECKSYGLSMNKVVEKLISEFMK